MRESEAMELDHESVVGFTKSWGLFYLMALAVAVLIYTFWPSNRKRFDRAKNSILDKEDRPGGPGDGNGEA
jgi:cytochrome c oxidase cbb3-type subunit 4